jgi:hypothetical protein
MLLRAFMALAIALSFIAPARAANSAGFDLRFTFKPARDTVATGTPGLWLDVCADAGCASVDASIPLGACQIEKTAKPGIVAITECSAHASGPSDDPGSVLALLDHPVDLRLRADNLTSPAFHFDGGSARVPPAGFAVSTTPDRKRLLVSVAAAAAGPAPSLCESAEDILFSCHAGKKIISICASKDLARDRGYLQYRFGLPAKIELSVPADRSVLPASSVTAGNLMFSGGGGAYLRFTAAGYEYVVYTAVGKGWGEKDGVAVERDGKRLSHVSCTDEPVSELGPDLADKAGLKPDAGDFDLP